jgi:hypothetical protein
MPEAGLTITSSFKLENLSTILYPDILAPPSSAARYNASSNALFFDSNGELSSITDLPVTYYLPLLDKIVSKKLKWFLKNLTYHWCAIVG